jgi:hypothetical protein
MHLHSLINNLRGRHLDGQNNHQQHHNGEYFILLTIKSGTLGECRLGPTVEKIFLSPPIIKGAAWVEKLSSSPSERGYLLI